MPSSPPDEFVEFISARLAQLRRAAYLLCGDLDRGDDVVQRTVTEVYSKWSRVRLADNPDAFIRTMLMRRFLDERRLSWNRVHLTDQLPEVAAPSGIDPGERLDLYRALSQLGKRQRAVIVLRFFYDLSVEQTADCLNISQGTVKSQNARGLATLRRLLGAEADDCLRSGHGRR